MSKIGIRKAAMINFVSKYSNIFIQLIINSVLARILTPDDYGIVAIITVFISFFTMIADMGIGPAIIQNKELNKKHTSDIFIFTFITSIIISIGFIIFSYPVSFFYNNKVYISLGAILSIGIFFNILNIVPNALILKEKRFKALGIRTIIINIACGVITILLSLKGAKYYALVINSVLVALFTFGFNFYYSKLKVYFSFSFESVKKISEFSSYQFAFNFINYFSRNLDNLLIGKFMGQVPLGYYDKAYKLMLYPVSNLTHVITPVLHPILSDYQNDREIIYKQYMRVVKLLAVLGVFFSVYCFFAAEEIIYIMFGSQWSKSVVSFKILSISICIQMVLSSSGTIFQATNETKKLFLAGVLGAIMNVSGIIMGVLVGKIEFVAIGIVIAYLTNFITGFYLLINRVFNRKLSKFILEFKSSFIIAIICSISMYVLNINISNNIISALYKLIICGVSYIIGLYITKEINLLFSILGIKRLNKKAKSSTSIARGYDTK